MKKFVLIIALVGLAACSPSPIPPSQEDAAAIAKSIKYTRDPRTGICYGITGTAASVYTTGAIAITSVDCSRIHAELLH
jgi:hypothetical protein